MAKPTSILVDTHGTGKVSDEKLTALVRKHFDLGPKGIVQMLDLLRPIYGGLHGKVELISPDTLRDDEQRSAGNDRYYRVLVRTTSSTLHAGGKDLPIIPGMTAAVEIRTGEKTVMDYILKPILKMREAFRER